MFGLNSLTRVLSVLILISTASAVGAVTQSVTITSPSNLAVFQETNGVANIPVTATASGVPSGGGVWIVLDGDTSNQVSAVKLKTPYSYTFKNVKVGMHTLDVYMIDSKGNLLGPSASLSQIDVGDISSTSGAMSLSINSPANLALFQHTNGVADIPVVITASGVPSGGGVSIVLDADTENQVTAVQLTSPYFYTFKNVKLGEHTLNAYMINSQGVTLGPTDSRQRIGVGDLIVCVGDSITAGEDDDITSDDWSADGRNGPYVDPIDGLSFGGFEPILNNLLTAARGYPHSVINQGMGTETSAGGLTRLPGILAQYPTANTWLIAYGTNDIHVGISPYTFESNLSKMVDEITATNPNASVYIPKILYGGQSNIGTYIDYIGNLVYYDGLHWGADMYTMFQTNLTAYNRMTGQAGTWYAVDSTPHPNGVGYQVIAKLYELALDHNAMIVADGTMNIVGRIWADKVQLTGVSSIGLNANNLLVVSQQPPTGPIPAGSFYADGGWGAYLGLTGAQDFSGGNLTANVRLEPWDLSNSGAASWGGISLSWNTTLIPTTRTVFSQYSADEIFTGTLSHVGQLVPVQYP